MSFYQQYTTRVILNGLTDLSIMQDVNVPQRYDYVVKASSVIFAYYDGRKHKEWPIGTKKLFRQALLRNVNYLTAPLGERPLHMLLMFKSALAYMSCDFPELADSLMYSPLMEEIDEVLDRMARLCNTTNINEVLRARLNMPSDVSSSNHSWWNILDEIENKMEIPSELAELFAEVNNRKEEELEIIRGAISYNQPELKKQYKNTELARSEMRQWAFRNLKFQQENISTISDQILQTEQQIDIYLWNQKFFVDGMERSNLERIRAEEKFDRLASTKVKEQ